MAVDIDLIRAYTDGAVYTHDPDTPGVITAPTTASAPLAAGFLAIGAVGENGIEEATNQDRTDVFIWQGNALVRKIPGQYTKEFTFAAAETSLLTLGIQYAGSTITQTTEGVTVVEKPPATDVRAWVLHGIDGATRAQRVYLPKAEVTNRGNVVWSSGGITVYEWTLSAYLDSAGAVAYRHYLDEALATP